MKLALDEASAMSEVPKLQSLNLASVHHVSQGTVSLLCSWPSSDKWGSEVTDLWTNEVMLCNPKRL